MEILRMLISNYRRNRFWSSPLFSSSTTTPQFDPGYNSHVIPNPVLLPKLHDFSKYHEAYVTVGKLQELYQVVFSFVDKGVQEMVPYPVVMPVMHDFDRKNREPVTLAVLRDLYKTLYSVETSHTPKSRPATGVGPSG